MSQSHFFAMSLVLLTSLSVACAQPTNPAAFPNERARVSYAIGMSLGQSGKDNQADLDPRLVSRGVKDALAGGATSLTSQEMAEALAQFGRELRVRQQQHREQVAESNRRIGEAFLATNRQGAGVEALPSGLQYQVLAEGAGPSPDLTNWVTLKFRGVRLNGAEFVGSAAHPAEGSFSLHGIIAGWTEALQLMKPGAKWRLFVPSALAYGPTGSPEAGPEETLVYDLELVAILPGPPPPTAEDLKNEREADGD